MGADRLHRQYYWDPLTRRLVVEDSFGAGAPTAHPAAGPLLRAGPRRLALEPRAAALRSYCFYSTDSEISSLLSFLDPQVLPLCVCVRACVKASSRWSSYVPPISHFDPPDATRSRSV